MQVVKLGVYTGSEWGLALLVAGSVRLKPVMREEEWNKFYCNFYFCWRDQAVFGRKENFQSWGKEKDEWEGKKKKNSKKIGEREWENSWGGREWLERQLLLKWQVRDKCWKIGLEGYKANPKRRSFGNKKRKN